ncbi:MAG: hypothetical protein KAI83_12395 [Thiomargarita sp.]|nr:hypothetical protein [Thiomargarita sp.]
MCSLHKNFFVSRNKNIVGAILYGCLNCRLHTFMVALSSYNNSLYRTFFIV